MGTDHSLKMHCIRIVRTLSSVLQIISCFFAFLSLSPLSLLKGYVPHTHVDIDPAYDISAEEFTAIGSLWADQGVKKCFEMRNKFPISDSAKQ